VNLAPSPTTAAAAAPATGFWQRRLVRPVLALLTQGVTAEKLTLTFSTGAVCSMFPFLGTTSLLNFGVGLWLRMNQPVLQTLNQLLTPVHLVMIVVYVRIGEGLWGATADRFTIDDMVTTFRDASFLEFLQRFGQAGIHAFTAWLVTAPLLFAGIYFPLRPVLRRLARRIAPHPTP
jgi:uncharacterized protein (DUF2062 family)